VSPRAASAYGGGDAARWQALVDQYAPLVARIAHHLRARLPASVQADDLIQAGMLGLLEAARRFEDNRGASFETYAGIRIRGAMLDEIRRGDWAPRSVHRNARRIGAAIGAVERRQGREAHDHEVAAELGIDVEAYHAALRDSLSCRLFSWEELTGDQDVADSGGSAPFDSVARGRFREQLAREIAELGEREQLVLSLYYEEEMNLKEIGAVLGVSESRISQIHSQVAAKLRARLLAWAKGG
jgi:RNA polymerase sigma factor for flagellar operon FliA